MTSSRAARFARWGVGRPSGHTSRFEARSAEKSVHAHNVLVIHHAFCLSYDKKTAYLNSAFEERIFIKKIENNFRQHIASLIRYQVDDGMWRQVLNNPNSYEETSCTAMFAIAIARGISNGWLSKKYKGYAVKAWKAVADHITSKGIVQGICRGTEIGADEQFYMNRKTIDNDPRGLGAVITAGIEMSKLK